MKLTLALMFALITSCALPTVNQTPFANKAEEYWNSQIYLTNIEIDEVFYYGIRVTLHDWQISYCSGPGNLWCVDDDTLEDLIGE